MSSAPGPAIDALALTLLKAFKQHADRTHEPAFAQDLARELGLGQGDVERAFRYLAEKGWVKTFSLPYAGRISAHGHDASRLKVEPIADEQRHFRRGSILWNN